MNLLEIMIEYLGKPVALREKYLSHMVEDCGMDPALIPHIRGIEKTSSAKFLNLYNLADRDGSVYTYLVELTSP